ncbi:MAG TPA: cell division protein ZapA [Oligoflexia bacterium]|nr:cell division protein ZapA [Oligoflexia bacterium]
MESEKKYVTVEILDQKFTFASDAPTERVERVAEFVNASLRDALARSKKPTPYHAAILVALNSAEKYFELLEKHDDFKSSVTNRSKKILGMLESVKGV